MTAQAPEDLILDGKKTSMTFCPPLPFGDPRFGVTREELALKEVAARIARDLRSFEHVEIEELMDTGNPEFNDRKNQEIRARTRQADVAAFRAKRIAEALEGATDKMPETYYAGETPLPKRTTAEELSAAVDLACQERPALPPRNTGSWRGYCGTWEVREDRFYLLKVKGTPSYTEGPPILADWFTGVLRIPRGEMLDYWHMGFGSTYEAELHITVDRGVVTKRRLFSARDLASGMNLGSLFQMGLPGTENRFPGDRGEIESKFPLAVDPGDPGDSGVTFDLDLLELGEAPDRPLVEFDQWNDDPDDLDLTTLQDKPPKN